MTNFMFRMIQRLFTVAIPPRLEVGKINELGTVVETSSFDDEEEAEDYKRQVEGTGHTACICRKGNSFKPRRSTLILCFAVLVFFLTAKTFIVRATPPPDGLPSTLIDFWEERTLLQQCFDQPGCHRYLTEVNGLMLQHGPLRDGHPHGKWELWHRSTSWHVDYYYGLYSPFKHFKGKDLPPGTNKYSYAPIKFRPNPNIPGVYPVPGSQPNIHDMHGRWLIPNKVREVFNEVVNEIRNTASWKLRDSDHHSIFVAAQRK